MEGLETQLSQALPGDRSPTGLMEAHQVRLRPQPCPSSLRCREMMWRLIGFKLVNQDQNEIETIFSIVSIKGALTLGRLYRAPVRLPPHISLV